MSALPFDLFAGFDRAVLLAFRHGDDPARPLGPHGLQQIMTDYTALGSFGVLALVSVIAVGYFLLRRLPGKALLVAGSAIGATLLNTGLKSLIDRPRPDVVPHLVAVDSLSFPSGHAMMSAVIYLTLGVLIAEVQSSRRLRCYAVGLAIALSLLIGISRLYLGVHWPSDVIGGWIIGGLWAWGCLAITRRHWRG